MDTFARELVFLLSVSRGGVLPGSAFLSCVQPTITSCPRGARCGVARLELRARCESGQGQDYPGPRKVRDVGVSGCALGLRLSLKLSLLSPLLPWFL